MDLELVEWPARLPVEISRRIEGMMRLGRYKPGERPPNEATLASGFGVSRNIVRKAVAPLKSHGLVGTRQGLGALVEELREESGFSVAPDSLTEPAALRISTSVGSSSRLVRPRSTSWRRPSSATSSASRPTSPFVSEIGPLNQVVHLWQYEDLADRERRRAAMADDPDWQEFLRRNEDLGALKFQENKILLPTAFSPLK